MSTFLTSTKQQIGHHEDGETTSPLALRNIVDSSLPSGTWDDLMFGADDLNKLGGFDPTSLSSSAVPTVARSAGSSSYPPNMPQSQDIFDILTEVENVLDESSPAMLMSMSNHSLSDDLLLGDQQPSRQGQEPKGAESNMFLLEPTPLGPADQVQIVDEVPVTVNTWRNDDSIINVLDPFMSFKRKMLSDEMSSPSFQPFKKQRTIPSESLSMEPATTTDDEKTSDNKSNTPGTNNNRFRSYQEEQWWERFTELMEFNKTNGHCLVPHKFPENPLLAQWVKRQRYQYKLKSRGDHSTLSDDRQQQLEALGFVWDSHRAAWDERFHELRSFKLSQGHVNVPSGYKHNPTLAVWVKCQRRQYRLFQSGKASNMNEERVQKLNSINFVWNPRQS